MSAQLDTCLVPASPAFSLTGSDGLFSFEEPSLKNTTTTTTSLSTSGNVEEVAFPSSPSTSSSSSSSSPPSPSTFSDSSRSSSPIMGLFDPADFELPPTPSLAPISVPLPTPIAAPAAEATPSPATPMSVVEEETASCTTTITPTIVAPTATSATTSASGDWVRPTTLRRALSENVEKLKVWDDAGLKLMPVTLLAEMMGTWSISTDRNDGSKFLTPLAGRVRLEPLRQALDGVYGIVAEIDHAYLPYIIRDCFRRKAKLGAAGKALKATVSTGVSGGIKKKSASK